MYSKFINYKILRQVKLSNTKIAISDIYYYTNC